MNTRAIPARAADNIGAPIFDHAAEVVKAPAPRISVIVPTYRRPQDLLRCLVAIAGQRRPADQILVTVRTDDAETQALLRRQHPVFGGVTVSFLSPPGVVAALNHALEQVTGDLIAILDDDTEPHDDWLARLEAHFARDPRLGAVGGRDILHLQDGIMRGPGRRVGSLQWFGRLIYNHETGVGGPRLVEFLKGCNMSFRREAVRNLRFDERMRGSGAQVYNDTAFSLAVRRAGWRVLYNPAILVDHYPGVRFRDAQREDIYDGRAIADAAHNEVLTLWEHLPRWRFVVFAVYAVVVGTRPRPGLLQVPRLRWLWRQRHAWSRFVHTMAGRGAALRTIWATRPSRDVRSSRVRVRSDRS